MSEVVIPYGQGRELRFDSDDIKSFGLADAITEAAEGDRWATRESYGQCLTLRFRTIDAVTGGEAER